MSNNSNFNYPRSGLNNVAEYQASGLPWVTSSQVSTTPFQIAFPFVTNELVIANNNLSGSKLRIGFTQNGVNGSNYYNVAPATTVTLDTRVTYVYVRGDSAATDFSLFAGLTQIAFRSMPVLTGSSTYNPAVTASVYGYDSGLG